uniref:Uncharacterized protein n=1 Tax=Panagrolaimus superbus TaxID=310955 RepID=A0A914YDG2_9BILA
MIKISENFIKAYTKLDSNETMLRMVETLFDDFSSSNISNITTTPSPISSPPIKTVTIFALICVLCLLAFVIIISSYDQSFCTDQNYIRERVWQFRRNRNHSETIGLVEVPFENISETIFGESPRIQAFSDSASSLSVEEAAILPSSRTEEDSINIRSPNLYIQIENDNLAEIKLTE